MLQALIGKASGLTTADAIYADRHGKLNVNPLPSSGRCRRYRNPMLLVNSYAESDPRESVIQYGHRLTSGLV